MERIRIYTDGGARGNPGPAGIGAVITDEHGVVLKKLSAYIGETTNNVAEYEALIRALHCAEELFGKKLQSMEVDVHMDSELIVRQLTGLYKVKNYTLKEKFAQVVSLRMKHIPHITFTHIPREANTHADALVNRALDAHEKHSLTT